MAKRKRKKKVTAKPRAKWSGGVRVNTKGICLSNEVDPNEARDVVDELIAAYGKIDPEDLLNACQKKTHPLHDAFNWDDTEAARRYRIEQARMIIRCIVVIPHYETREANEPVRAYVSTEKNDQDRGYTTISIAMSDPDDRNYVLQRALNTLCAWRKQWRQLNEYADAVSAIEKVDQSIDELRQLVAR